MNKRIIQSEQLKRKFNNKEKMDNLPLHVKAFKVSKGKSANDVRLPTFQHSPEKSNNPNDNQNCCCRNIRDHYPSNVRSKKDNHVCNDNVHDMDIDLAEDNSMWSGLKLLLSESTAHGIERLVTGSTPRAIFWFIIFCICMLMVSLQIASMVAEYLQHKKVMIESIERELGGPAPQFPQVIICSHNMVNRERAQKAKSVYTHLDSLEQIAKLDLIHNQKIFDDCIILISNTSIDSLFYVRYSQNDFFSPEFRTCLKTESDKRKHLLDAVLQKFVNETNSEKGKDMRETFIKTYLHGKRLDYGDVQVILQSANMKSLTQVGMTLDEMLVHCSYKQYLCTTRDFHKKVSDTYGTCYSFTPPNEAQPWLMEGANIPAYEKGLSMVVRLDMSLNANLFTSSSGLRIGVYDHNTSHAAAVEDQGISTLLGYETFVQINKRKIERISTKYDECIDTWPLHYKSRYKKLQYIAYDPKLCRMLCVMSQMEVNCSCTPSLLYATFDLQAQLCNFLTQKNQYDCVKKWADFNETADRQCRSECRVPCHTTGYHLEHTEIQSPIIASVVQHLLDLYISQNKDAKRDATLWMKEIWDHVYVKRTCLNSTDEIGLKVTNAGYDLPAEKIGEIWLTMYKMRRKDWRTMKADFKVHVNLLKKIKDEMSDRYARIHIFRRSTEVERTYEKRETALDQILAEIGGVMGLWIGSSIITMVEFLEILCYVVSKLIQPKQQLSSEAERNLMDKRRAAGEALSIPSVNLMRSSLNLEKTNTNHGSDQLLKLTECSLKSGPQCLHGTCALRDADCSQHCVWKTGLTCPNKLEKRNKLALHNACPINEGLNFGSELPTRTTQYKFGPNDYQSQIAECSMSNCQCNVANYSKRPVRISRTEELLCHKHCLVFQNIFTFQRANLIVASSQPVNTCPNMNAIPYQPDCCPHKCNIADQSITESGNSGQEHLYDNGLQKSRELAGNRGSEQVEGNNSTAKRYIHVKNNAYDDTVRHISPIASHHNIIFSGIM